MNEPTVTMTLAEYQRLIDTIENFEKVVREGYILHQEASPIHGVDYIWVRTKGEELEVAFAKVSYLEKCLKEERRKAIWQIIKERLFGSWLL